MSKKVHSGTYYKLTDSDKEQISRYFNKSNPKELIEFCQIIVQIASYATWRNAKLYLKEVGEEKFFNSCSNCGNMFDCEPMFALDKCGNWYEKWIPMTKEQEDRLMMLRKKIEE